MITANNIRLGVAGRIVVTIVDFYRKNMSL